MGKYCCYEWVRFVGVASSQAPSEQAQLTWQLQQQQATATQQNQARLRSASATATNIATRPTSADGEDSLQRCMTCNTILKSAQQSL
jgi:hypothetical protein